MPTPYDIYPHFGRLAEEKTSRGWISRQIPMHLWYRIRAEVSIARLRLGASKVRAALRDVKGARANIAPGGRPFQGWVNLDVSEGAGIDHRYDCRKNLPFADRSVATIYCEHFVEHLEYSEEAQRFIAECHRVLMPDGLLRIVVPHAGKFLDAYASGDPSTWTRLIADEPWFEGKWHTPMELINLIFRQGIEHHFAYDAETLCLLCTRHGLVQATERGFNDTDISDFPGDCPSRKAYSLYVEARRQGDPGRPALSV